MMKSREHGHSHRQRPDRLDVRPQFKLDLMHGPFDVDACADAQGHNAQCARYWSPKIWYSRHSWAGLKVWCNSPFQEIDMILDHAVASYYEDMDRTSVLLAIPDWPDAKWWRAACAIALDTILLALNYSQHLQLAMGKQEE